MFPRSGSKLLRSAFGTAVLSSLHVVTGDGRLFAFFASVFCSGGFVVVRFSDALFLVAVLLSVVDACSIYYCSSSSSNDLLQYSIVHGL